MKKYLIIIITLFFNLNILSADDRVDQLNKLFNELKMNNSIIANEVELFLY